MSRSLVLAAAATLALVAGCTSEDKPKAAAPPASVPAATAPSTAPATGTPTTAPTGPPTGTPSVPVVKFQTPQAAVDHFLNAFTKGDRAAAYQAAGPNTVQKFWTEVPAGAKVALTQCVPGSESGSNYAYDCYERYEGGSKHYYVNKYGPSNWRVENFTQVAD